MKRNLFIGLLIVFSLSGCVGIQSTPNEFVVASRIPLEWAQILVKNISLDDTSYQHKQGVVTWAGVNGASRYESQTDCSGLINALLEQSYGLTPTDFERFFSTDRPLAITYYDAVVSQNQFKRIVSIYDVQPGDFIVIKYPPDNDNSGHIMLVAAAPQKYPLSNPELGGTEQWIITVIDSSETGHGTTDTRWQDDGTFHDGLGQGVFRIYTDDAGEPVGYTWSTFPNSEYYSQQERPLVIGRTRPQMKTMPVISFKGFYFPSKASGSQLVV